MRLVTFVAADGHPRVGILSSDGQAVAPLRGLAASDGLLAVIDAGIDLAMAPTDEAVPLAKLRLLAPIPRPRRNLFCVGKNYHEHVREFANSGYDASVVSDAPPAAPIIFSKLPQCVIPHGAPIVFDPAVTQALDYEAELAVVIGRRGRAIRAADALDHVWGYTIANDVTARDVQKTHQQWLLGKSQDTFCPLGPCAVTRDALDPARASIKCWINDELRQSAHTGMMIFDVPMLIETISRGITLEPGDIILTGTPSGVGIGFQPPRFLVAGDRVRIEIEGIGVLENMVQAYGANA